MQFFFVAFAFKNLSAILHDCEKEDALSKLGKTLNSVGNGKNKGIIKFTKVNFMMPLARYYQAIASLRRFCLLLSR
jgi:hypothetical protein